MRFALWPGHDDGAFRVFAMTIHLHTQADLEEAVEKLLRQDPRLKPILAVTGMPSLRRREAGFVGLAHIVCGQQLSTASAAAIWGRLSAAFDPFHHEAVRRARADRRGRLGLSAAKIKTLKHIARELAEERLNLDVLAEEDADAAHQRLRAPVAVRRDRRVRGLSGVREPQTSCFDLHPDCLRWIAEREVAVLGSDGISDPIPGAGTPDWPFPVHQVGIVGLGMPLIDNVATEQLSASCAAAGRWAFLFSMSPLRITGGTGCPINPVAVL